KRERIEFAQTVNKYDRRFKCTKRDLLLSAQFVYLIGREKIKKGSHKGQFVEVVKRKLPLETITAVSMSPLQDDFFVIHVANDFDSVLESRLPATKGGKRPGLAAPSYQQQSRGPQQNLSVAQRGRSPSSKSSFVKGRTPSLHSKGAKGKARRDSSNTDYSQAEFMKTPQGG
uniref:TH1 domain-containing protein n=1 Tax=Amphimedon queenslandica TaxID=400682 RepID=A0A1X7T3C7_AMPQE